jgi:tetratricopeptide (TPR) repeat protein
MKKWIAIVAISAMSFGCSSHKTTAQSNVLNGGSSFDTDKAPPVNANSHFAAGQLDETHGHITAAIQQYFQALKIDPDNQPSLYRLAVIYTEQKNYDKALGYWTHYLNATDKDPVAYSNLGFCYELDGKPDAAAMAYKDGIKRDPKNVACRTNYGLMLAREGHLEEATRMWQPVLTDAEVHYNLAGVYDMSGRKTEAKAEYEKAIALDPSLIDAKNRLAGLDMN